MSHKSSTTFIGIPRPTPVIAAIIRQALAEQLASSPSKMSVRGNSLRARDDLAQKRLRCNRRRQLQTNHGNQNICRKVWRIPCIQISIA